MSDIFAARFRESDRSFQALSEHLRNTSAIAKMRGGECGFGETAGLCALLHDCGKYTSAFQNYLRAAANGQHTDRGSVVHSIQGAYVITKLYEQISDQRLEELKITRKKCATARDIMRVSIMSHHGLCDALTPEGEFPYQNCVAKNIESCKEAAENLFREISEDELLSRFILASAEIAEIYREITALIKAKVALGSTKHIPPHFYFGFCQRYITSLIIDADRTDSACYGENKVYTPISSDRSQLWEQMRFNLESELEKTRALSKSRLNAARDEISELCANYEFAESGIYKLSVPCGGGKTIAGLRAALRSASMNRGRRIFYIAPFTSILEQNADELRRYTGCPSDVLEHHSNVLFGDDNGEDYRVYSSLTENWESSAVVATTAVQFLDTLFSDSTRCVRRLASLMRSVVIVDELQALPVKTYKLFSAAMSCLAELFGCTVILCSATQPLLDLNDSWRISTVKKIIPDENRYYEIFRRCAIRPMLKQDGYDISEAARFVYDKAAGFRSLLCIVNTKEAAREICEYIRGRFSESTEQPLIIHLSTNMYPAHRAKCIRELRNALDNIKATPESARRVVCISTQLIEAGVDISFSQVIRSSAGLDSVIQAAGRCNREGGGSEDSAVWVININEELPNSLKPARKAGEGVIEAYGGNDGATGYKLLTKDAMDLYYAKYMSDIGDKMAYPIKDDLSICSLLAKNITAKPACGDEPDGFYIRQAYKTAGENFKVIDDAGIDVIVECKEAEPDILTLTSTADVQVKRKALRRLQRYSVSLNYGMQKALENALIKHDTSKKGESVFILPACYYDGCYGVGTEKITVMETYIC